MIFQFFFVFVLVSQPAGNLLKENVTPKSILFLVIKGEEYLLLEIFLLSAVNSDKSATSYGWFSSFTAEFWISLFFIKITWRLKIVQCSPKLVKKRDVWQKSSCGLWCNVETTSLVKPQAPLKPHSYSALCVSLGAFSAPDGESIENRNLERWEPTKAVRSHLDT